MYKKTLTNLSNLIYKNNCKEIIYKNINDNEFKLNLVGYNEYTSKNEKDKKNYLNIFDVNNNKKIITLKNKTTKITKNTFLPKNYKFKLYPGDKLEINDNAFIFSESHWELLGTKENPIIISGNENNYGGGIYIYNNFENNVIKNTYFENLSGTKYINSSEKINLEYLKKFNLMGSVNFYNVKLNLEHIYFNKFFLRMH